ncbi:hypothetical protein A2625_02725 [candidate division WOR-1 bacterium RIFCSPHIGHO2_01_FULL_53_15]|uniref:Antitoxin n=1 Tax=candidate division WOR-1 bacterium RIFCSPHIGHO2_01_FULL_53_15 TaxID=1802564 RepID=A0A1F4Q2S2_UNCSA|nr:MAG: hypothetical protein A2625_02725 [candidate division WOR-1 bacterium RIFCSPHIGHO2_01_FULL_53_15]
MNFFKEKFLVDEKGRKIAVMLDAKGYEKLMAHLEDLEDSLELKKAVKHEKEKGLSLAEYLAKHK